jgi:hypothetical protein
MENWRSSGAFAGSLMREEVETEFNPRYSAIQPM